MALDPNICETDSGSGVIKRAAQRLLPVPLDGWLLATGLLWMASILVSLLWHSRLDGLDAIDLPMPIMAGTLGIVSALCICAVFGCISRRIVFLSFATISIGFVLLFTAADEFRLALPVYFGDVQPDFDRPLPEYVQAYAWLPVGTLALLLTSLIGVVAIRRFPVSPEAYQHFAAVLKKYRIRVMVGFVIVMFPAVVLRNVFDPGNRTIPYFIAGLGGLGGLILLLLLLGLVIKGRRLACVMFVGLIVTIVAFAALNTHLNEFDFEEVTDERFGVRCATILAPTLFMLTLASAVFWRDSRRGWSVWTIMIPLLGFGGIAFSMRYDPRIVISKFVDSPTDFMDGTWRTVARESKQLQEGSGGAVSLIPKWGQKVLLVRVRDDGDANCLQRIAATKNLGIGFVMIENLQPFVDTEPLIRLGMHILIDGGKPTSRQLLHISQCHADISIRQAHLPSRNDHGASFDTVFTQWAGEITGFSEFLDAYASNVKKMVLQHNLKESDWDAIVRNCQRCKFDFYRQFIPEKVMEASLRQSLSGMTVYDFSYPRELKGQRQLLLSSIRFSCPSIQSQDVNQLKWELAIVKPGIGIGLDELPELSQPFVRRARELHWAYGWNEDDAITHLWLPDSDSVAAFQQHLQSTRTLRLDREGVVGLAAPLHNSTNTRPLGNLPNLERLYLDRGSPANDLTFLATLAKLQHLQIQASERSMFTGSGFNVCANLESIRFFGSPDKKSIKELKTLSKLKRVEIVDDDLLYQDENEVAKLQIQLPSVRILIIHPEDFEPDLTKKWEEHVERVRNVAIQRLDDEIAKQESR